MSKKLYNIGHRHREGESIKKRHLQTGLRPVYTKNVNSTVKSCLNILNRINHLSVLEISRNRIKDLPVEIGNLKNLVTLDLSNNQGPML
jgi:Leucine-rich repeat (LRR) protein